jgi:hypothetical protein
MAILIDAQDGVTIQDQGGVDIDANGGFPAVDAVHDLRMKMPDGSFIPIINHALYGPRHVDVDDSGTPVLDDGLYSNGTQFELDRRTKAVGNFVGGTAYQRGTELSNGGDLSECLVDGTTSAPFVQPTGDPRFIFQGTMSDTAQLAKQIIFGNRYLSDSAFYVDGSRVNTVVGNEYKMYSVQNVGLPNEIVTLLRNFTATVDGWTEFSIDATAVNAGVLFDVIAIVNEPDPTPVEVIASYNYQTPQNPAIPAQGAIQQARSQADLMRISYVDNNAIDRTALIQGLSIGDTILIGAINFAVQSNTDQTTYADIIVAPAVVATAGIQDITFETVTATPITVAEDLAYWPTSDSPQVQGLKGVDIPYEDIVPDTNAYGVDLIVQGAYVPDPSEWLLKVIAGQGGGSGLNAVETRWIQQSAAKIQKALMTTTDGAWQEFYRATLMTDGNGIRAKFLVEAKRADAVGFYVSEFIALGYREGAVVIVDDVLDYELGDVLLDVRATVDGLDIVFEGRGRPSQTWNWQFVLFFNEIDP